MKTNQIMTRTMGDFKVIQRTCDGKFDCTSLLSQWNSSNRNNTKKISDYLRLKETKDFVKALMFLDFAMWLNPAFKVKVLKFVQDEMIRYRNDAGDAYKELSSAVMKIVPSHFMPKAMQKIGEALNWIIFNSHEKMLRNKHGDEDKQRELWQLEKKIAGLIEEGFISTYEQLISYLRKLYRKNWEPKVLTV